MKAQKSRGGPMTLQGEGNSKQTCAERQAWRAQGGAAAWLRRDAVHELGGLIQILAASLWFAS
jgi:hypothetical protein